MFRSSINEAAKLGVETLGLGCCQAEEGVLSGLGLSISGAEVTKVVKKLKALEEGLSWLTCLCNIIWTSGAVPLDVVVFLFKKGDWRICFHGDRIALLSLTGKVYVVVPEKIVRLIA